jgi:hypothetical protein
MGIVDIIIAAGILAGCGWILYRSFWKKKGGCHDCTGCSCGGGK